MGYETVNDLSGILYDLCGVKDILDALANEGYDDAAALHLLSEKIESVFEKLEEITIMLGRIERRNNASETVDITA